MFLKKDYILANELVQQMDIHIANISIMRNNYESGDDYTTIVKMNNCSFVNTKSSRLPRNIANGIKAGKFTDVSDKLPCTHMLKEYGITMCELKRAGIIEERINICGKYFYKFKADFVELMQTRIPYILDESEVFDCKRKGEIDGYVKLGRDKYLSWYSPRNKVEEIVQYDEHKTQNLISANQNRSQDYYG